MKKWEKIEVKVLSLEKTEEGSIVSFSCSDCGRKVQGDVATADIEDVICKRCTCCGTPFHADDYPDGEVGALNAAREHALTCQCS